MKKLRPEVQTDLTKVKGDLFGMMDMYFLSMLNMTIDEMEYVATYATDEEQDTLMSANTFSERRLALTVRNKYVKKYRELCLGNLSLETSMDVSNN